MKNLFKFNIKSIVQRKARWLLTFIAILTIGPGQMWAGTKRIYLVPNDWNQASAKMWVHSWHDSDQGVSDVQFAALSGDADIFFADIPDTNNKYIFTRTSSTSTSPWGANGEEWARNTFDNAVTNGSKNCCFIRSINSNDAEMQTLTTETVYYTSSATTVQVNVSRQNDNGTAKLWRLVTMTDTGKRYDGNKLYKGTFYVIFGGLYKLQFREDGTYGSMIISSWTSSSTYNGKIYHSSAWRTYEYDHVIKSGSTVVWDLGNESTDYWPANSTYMYRMHYVASANNDQLTKISNSNQRYKTYNSDTYCKAFLFINNNTATWTDYRFTTDITGDACDVDGITLFTYPNTVTNTAGHYKLDWQVTKNAKKATSGVKIYFDNTDANWSKIWLKYGTQWFNRSSAASATKVTGTDNLYVITMPNDAYYAKYYLADNVGYVNYNDVEDKGGSTYLISNRIASQESNLSSDITYIPSSGDSATPKVWTTSTIAGGHTRQVSISAPSHGSITVTYTDESGTSQTKTSGNFNVAQTCIITVSSSADAGYSPASLTIGGASHTSGNTYIVRGDVTIAATFTEDLHDVTVAYKCGETSIASDGTIEEAGIATAVETSAPTIAGYAFTGWTLTDGVTLASGTTSDATISINATADSKTITANYVVRYGLYGSLDADGNPTNGMPGWSTPQAFTYSEGTYSTTVTLTKPNNTYKFRIIDRRTGSQWGLASKDVVPASTATTLGSTTADAQLATTGVGTYTLTVTEADEGTHPRVTISNPTSYVVTFASVNPAGGSIAVVDGEATPNAIANGNYIKAGGTLVFTATPASDAYTFAGWYSDEECETAYSAGGNVVIAGATLTLSSIGDDVSVYAKWHSTKFVIYRSGDMDVEDDPRVMPDDVESYAGGTPSDSIEFRMQVRSIGQWYSLCLPFTVSAVRVWDDEDGRYYPLVPYYRTGGKFYSGHYVIRTPKQTTNFPISEFSTWNDPASATEPSANTPYIIMWPHAYFSGRYVSFFGAATSIPSSMTPGSAPESDNVVNVCVNQSMTTGSVSGAYLLEGDYGGGAWLRLDNNNARTIPAFECYLLAKGTGASPAPTRIYIDPENTATGWENITDEPAEVKMVLIDNQLYIIRDDKMYTIQGTLVK